MLDDVTVKSKTRRSIALPLIVGIVSAFVFAGWPPVSDRMKPYSQAEFFADESADIAQSYYFRLFFLRRDLNHVDWLHYAAFDHLPVFKYLIGASLALHGEEVPTSLQRLNEWYMGDYRAYPPSVLAAARLPMLLGAAFGCSMIFVLGRQLNGTMTGLLAAILLASSPLYYLHARRAMADDLVYAFVLASFSSFLWLSHSALASKLTWKRFLAIVLLGGVLTALAPATKLNGGTAGISIGVVALLCLFAKASQKILAWKTPVFFGALLMGIVSCVIFIGINPTFYAQPKLPAEAQPNPQMSQEAMTQYKSWLELMHKYAAQNMFERGKTLIEHRAEVVKEGGKIFPHLALPTIGSRAKAIIVDGMGLHTAVGNLPAASGFNYRFVLPVVLCCVGLCIAFLRGLTAARNGRPPLDWLLIVWPIAELGVLLPGMTVNFDRYFMGIVVWTTLICAYAFIGIFQSIGRGLVLAPPGEEGAES